MLLVELRNKPGVRLMVIGAIAFFLFALILGLHRHFTFYSSYDQGIFNQVFWNGLHGRFFQSSLSSQLSTNVVHNGEIPAVYYHRLGQHFTPDLLLWLPIYFLFPFPATLTVLQVVLVTASGVVLYILARQYLQPPVAGLITVSYYAANAILGPTLANFHDISQTPIIVFGILLAMEKRQWWILGILSILMLGIREDSGIGLFSIGTYMLVSRRYPIIGTILCVGSFIYMIALTNLIMPLFSEDISKRFMLERFGQYVQTDNASTLDIIWAMVSQPHLVLIELFSPLDQTIFYLMGQWLPLAFVPAVAPASWLVAGFPLLKLLLGKGMSVLSITIRYAMTVAPGLFYGAILWWAGQGWYSYNINPEKLEPRKLTPRFRSIWIFCISLSLVLTVTANPNRTFYFLIPDSVQPWVHVSLPQQWTHAAKIYSLMGKIPPDASVSATTYIIPHLSGRREIIRLPELEIRNDQKEVIMVDYAIADLEQLRRYQPAFKDDAGLLDSLVKTINSLSEDKKYGITGFVDGVILLQKGVTSDVQSQQDWWAYQSELDLKD